MGEDMEGGGEQPVWRKSPPIPSIVESPGWMSGCVSFYKNPFLSITHVSEPIPPIKEFFDALLIHTHPSYNYDAENRHTLYIFLHHMYPFLNKQLVRGPSLA